MTSAQLRAGSRSGWVSPGDKPVWQEDGRGWPNREASWFVRASDLTWHVQQLGEGPAVLLVHGTGAATHSWRALAPLLARHFAVVAPDLPGHGFTESPRPDRLSLPGMANALGELMQSLGVVPRLAIGHSAGAAIVARMSLDGQISPRGLIGLNAAMLPLRGLPGHLFSPMARVLSASTLVPRLFARHAANPRVVDNLLRETGSRIDAEGVELYRRLVRRPGHAAAALDMMAHWELRSLMRDLPQLKQELALVIGRNDRAIPPREAGRVRALVPSAALVTLPLGHLAHEEKPAQIADLVGRFARDWGVLEA